MADEHKFRRIVWLILLGGTSFWGPITVVDLVTRVDFFSLELYTALPPTMLLLCYALFRRHYEHWTRCVSLWMLLGVYMLGTWFMFIGFTPSGGGFSQPFGWDEVAMLFISTVVPFITLLFSGYQGTLFGLLAATLIMLVLHTTLENRAKGNSA